MGFTITNAQGDAQNFGYWTTNYDNLSGSSGVACTVMRGFRLNSWTFPQGMTVNLAYTAAGEINSGPVNDLLSVSNTLGRQINFTSSGLAGFNNNLSGADARAVSVTSSGGSLASVDFHTDPAGNVTTFVRTALSDHFLLHLIYTPDNPPVGLSGSTTGLPDNPASLEYDWDTLKRVEQAYDADALQLGTRGPYEFYIANGIRGERQDPTGASYAVEYDLWKRPLELFRRDRPRDDPRPRRPGPGDRLHLSRRRPAAPRLRQPQQ